MLSLFALMLASDPAFAANTPKVKYIRIRENTVGDYKMSVLTDNDPTIQSVKAEISSDTGSENVTLTESNATLHGEATLAALPTTKGTLTVTLYDASSLAVATLTGSLDSDGVGSVTLTSVTSGDISSYDLEVLATNTFLNADGSYALTLDLAGAETYNIAYADITLKETVKGTPVCLAYDEKKNCLKWDTPFVSSETNAEVGWDSVGSLWESDITGGWSEAEVEVEALSSRGKKLDKAEVNLVAPWDAGTTVGAGALWLSYGGGLSSGGGAKELADILENQYGIAPASMTTVSDGWSSTSTLPDRLDVELDNGETWSIPVNSYQVTGMTDITFVGTVEKEEFTVTVDGVSFDAATAYGERGLCQDGICVAIVEDSGFWTLSATAYATDAASLPASVDIELGGTLGLASTKELSYTVHFDPEIAVVFGEYFEFVGDPVGLGLSGTATLYGTSSRGRTKELDNASFAGTFMVDESGDLGLATAEDKNLTSSGGTVLDVAPIEVDPVIGADVVPLTPPAIILSVYSNGSGTRKVAANTSQTQSQLL